MVPSTGDRATRLRPDEWLVLHAAPLGQIVMWLVQRLPSHSAVRRHALSVGLRSAAKLLRRGEFERVLWAFEPEVEYRLVGWSGPTGLEELYTGHAGVRAVFEEWTPMLGPPDFTIERVIGLDDGAFATARLRGQGAASGAMIDRQVASIFRFSRRGRISHWDSYWNPVEAQDAAGHAAGQRI